MQIDYAFILSAGLGTRMGEIGKKLPKVLWPIYRKTMLELQIRYCEDLGIKKIFINTHFLHEDIKSFIKESPFSDKVTILHEDPLLDSGGGIHNLASRPEVNYKGNLLLVNGDQFLFFNQEYWNLALGKISKSRAVLFGIKVDKASAYNETVLEGGRLIDIKKNIQKDLDYITYSGLGILNLNELTPVPGISRFFDTVADYKNEKIELLAPADFEYWDFGTAEIFAENILKLQKADHENSAMGKFLKKYSALDGSQNLFVDAKNNSIDLEYLGRFLPNTIQAKGVLQKF
ncbi:MAG: nucleotidyltransferase family protein [Bacteriovorax sp.]